jgi:hypothetical protein
MQLGDYRRNRIILWLHDPQSGRALRPPPRRGVLVAVGPAGVAPVRARDAAIREFVAAHYLYLGSGRAAAAAAARDLRPTGAQRRRRPGGGAVRLDWRLIAALPLSQIPWRSAGLMSALASGVVNAASIDFETLDNEPIRKGRAAACEF